jgi:hypothetical protein
MHQREHRRQGADRHREHEHRGGGESGSAGETPPGMADYPGRPLAMAVGVRLGTPEALRSNMLHHRNTSEIGELAGHEERVADAPESTRVRGPLGERGEHVFAETVVLRLT